MRKIAEGPHIIFGPDNANLRDQFSRSTARAQTTRNNGRYSMTSAEGISGGEVEC